MENISGPELNKAIAQKVFGWRMYHYNDLRSYWMLLTAEGDSVEMQYAALKTYRAYEHPSEEEAWALGCPDFCQNIAAAWLVVEKMLSLGYDCSLTNNFGYWICGMHGYVNATEPTAPMSICRAALKVLDHESY